MTSKAAAVSPTSSRSKPKAPAPVPVEKSRHLAIAPTPGKTQDRQFADLVTSGLVSNASTAIRFNRPEQGDVSLTDLVASLKEHGEAVNRGDLGSLERMLSAQTVALNSIFIELARRAAMNMGEHLGATESYMRLALKAQAQCRTAVEALAEMKNPHPVAFVKQANIANGPQQVNNSANPGERHAGLRAEESKPPQSKQLELQHGEWLDTGASGTTSGVDPHLEAVGEVDRAPKHRR